ncbi:hypothetical protein LOAG_00993 [Loa loa]|uniref:Uncharacterized protein n=1 Tax=Loa loa TaxID=7209 RepID=A0A1S0UA72_LOALO|nr:hypothetical protein LOAG_00993 [Loa loa]EFO27482.1 hypothetical protein LOAG_00993 [Loa loa]
MGYSITHITEYFRFTINHTFESTGKFPVFRYPKIAIPGVQTVHLFTFGTTILLVHRIWTRERPLMKKAQDAAFRLYDQVFQSLVPKGLNDKFLKVEESKSKEA